MSSNQSLEVAGDCDAIRELIPDYAFGLTNPEETRLVESNLGLCPEAAAELADYQHLQAEMRAGVPQVEPPHHLQQRLMAAIATSERTMHRRTFRWQWLAVAAMIALVMTNLYWFARVNDLNRRQDEFTPQTDEDGAFVLTSTSNLRWVRLPPTDEKSEASAFLMWNAESKIGLLYARGFPELTAGKSYQLWLTRGEIRASAGTFRVNDEGIGALLFNITEPIDQFTWARITAEPENGSDQPSDAVVVVGEL